MKNFFYYRFDLTKKTPPHQNFMGANCNVTPQLKKNFYYRFDSTKKTPPPPSENFMGANHNVTPQWKIFFVRDLTWQKDPPPSPGENVMGVNCNVTPASSCSLQTQQKPRVTEAQHNAEKHFLLLIYYKNAPNLLVLQKENYQNIQ